MNKEPRGKSRGVLIVTATKTEAKAVLKVFIPDVNQDLPREPIGDKTYYKLGLHGGVPVYMVQSNMGIATPGGALMTVHQAIQDLHPQAVIMCGIGFGLNPGKQELGDILISKQLHYYEPQKIDVRKGKLPRGDKVTASERLIDRFVSADLSWTGTRTQFGLILSGEKLVNDPPFLRGLLKLNPEAIGGEMEGAGLYTAARQAKTDWILVKAICDFGDGNKSDDVQATAANNAAKFVLHVLQLGGFTEDPAGHTIKQFTDPVQIVTNLLINVAESTPPRSHLQVDASNTKARYFVNREKELSKLTQIYGSTFQDKKIHTVLINGDFGTGKTTLIGKFLSEIKDQQERIICWAQCIDANEKDAWFPFLDIYKQILAYLVQRHSYDIDELAQFCLEHTPAWLRLLSPDLGETAIRTPFSQEAIYSQFFYLLRKISEQNDLVVVIDDLQWADTSSLGLLLHLNKECIDYPVLIISAMRPEGMTSGHNAVVLSEIHARLMLMTNNVTEIDLPCEIDTRSYIVERYRMEILPKSMIKELNVLSAGHALFLDQFFNYLEKEEESIHKNPDGSWVFNSEFTKRIVIPKSIDELLNIRIKSMRDTCKKILKMASIEGEDFSVQIVSILANFDEDHLVDELRNIHQDYRFTAEKGREKFGSFTFDIYRFTHRFFREHIYSQLEGHNKRKLHKKVGKYLENARGDKRAIAGKLAYHFQEGGKYRKAFKYSVIATREAYKNYKWSEAVEYAKNVNYIYHNCLKDRERALTKYADTLLVWEKAAQQYTAEGITDEIMHLIEQVRNNPNLLHIYARLLLALGHIYYLGDHPDSLQVITDAIRSHQELHDEQGEYEAKGILADTLIDKEGKFSEGIILREELIAHFESLGNIEEIIFHRSSLAWAVLHIGQYGRALNEAEKALAISKSINNRNLLHYAFALRVCGLCHYRVGNYEKARDYQKEAILRYKNIGDTLEECWTRHELGQTYFIMGNIDLALQEYNVCLDYAEKTYDTRFQGWINLEFSKVMLSKGDLENSEYYIQNAQKHFRKLCTPDDLIDYHTIYAKYYLLKGDYTGAEDNLNSALIITKGNPLCYELVRIYNLYGNTCLIMKDIPAALSWMEKSVTLCQTNELVVDLAETYEQLGKIHEIMGDHRSAKEDYRNSLEIRKNLHHQHKVDELSSRLLI